MATLEELLDQWEELRDAGVEVEAEQICHEHPELLPEFKKQIAALKAFDSKFGVEPLDSAHPQPTVDWLPPENLALTSRFQLQGCYAVGGLGQVHIAFDQVLKRKVAVKFPKRQGMKRDQLARFEQEARITGQLDHPGIVPIHAMDSATAGEPCYVMRFIEGDTLQQSVENSLATYKDGSYRNYFESDAFRNHIRAIIAVCNTCAFAHKQKILHRDIKPNNILLGPFGETILLDWGIAKPVLDSPIQGQGMSSWEFSVTDGKGPSSLEELVRTEPGRGLGTPAYASPEQLLGMRQGITSDVYSLGVTLFFVLTGKTPLELVGWGGYLKAIQQPNTNLADRLPALVPTGLRAICAKAMCVEPGKRYASALELAKDLDHVLVGEALSVLPEGLWTRLARQIRKHPGLSGSLMSGALAVLLAIVVVSIVTWRKNNQLMTSNQQLEGALKNLQAASELTMKSLRSMSSDAVLKRFAQQERLSDSDRGYIESILQHYLGLADLQGTNEQSLRIRAEANGQIGLLHYKLGNPTVSVRYLKSAVEHFDQLGTIRHRLADQLELADYLENLAAAQLDLGRYDETHATSARAIDLILRAQFNQTSEESQAFAGGLADLYVLRGLAGRQLNKIPEALSDYREAMRILDLQMQLRPDDASLKLAAGSNLRTYASLLNETATTKGEKEEALSQVNRSIELFERLTKVRPDAHNYRSNIAWAHYDRSFIYRELGDLPKAIEDMQRATELTRELTEQFPLISRYRERLPAMHHRTASLFMITDALPLAFEHAEAMASLTLTTQQVEMATDLIESILSRSLERRSHDGSLTDEQMVALEDKLQKLRPSPASP